MVGMVIEVPEELKGLGVVMAEVVASVWKKLHQVGGGKAVDYVEVERALADGAARVEQESHRAILQALDVDRPGVEIGGKRFARVGRSDRCRATTRGNTGALSMVRCTRGRFV